MADQNRGQQSNGNNNGGQQRQRREPTPAEKFGKLEVVHHEFENLERPGDFRLGVRVDQKDYEGMIYCSFRVGTGVVQNRQLLGTGVCIANLTSQDEHPVVHCILEPADPNLRVSPLEVPLGSPDFDHRLDSRTDYWCQRLVLNWIRKRRERESNTVPTSGQQPPLRITWRKPQSALHRLWDRLRAKMKRVLRPAVRFLSSAVATLCKTVAGLSVFVLLCGVVYGIWKFVIPWANDYCCTTWAATQVSLLIAGVLLLGLGLGVKKALLPGRQYPKDERVLMPLAEGVDALTGNNNRRAVLLWVLFPIIIAWGLSQPSGPSQARRLLGSFGAETGITERVQKVQEPTTEWLADTFRNVKQAILNESKEQQINRTRLEAEERAKKLAALQAGAGGPKEPSQEQPSRTARYYSWCRRSIGLGAIFLWIPLCLLYSVIATREELAKVGRSIGSFFTSWGTRRHRREGESGEPTNWQARVGGFFDVAAEFLERRGGRLLGRRVR